MIPIWTLDSRDSTYLEVMESLFDPAGPQMQHLIVGMHAELLRDLSALDFIYESFRTALVPQNDKQERAFLFNSTLIDEAWYGGDIALRLVPALERNHNCSILSGDLILSNQEVVRSALTESAILHKPLDVVNTSLIYVVYINNLSSTLAQTLHEKLLPYAPYIGYIPSTYSSRAKDLLSLPLMSTYLKIGTRWLCVGEDDSVIGTANSPGWPLEDNGYTCHSVSAPMFHTFLTYKIERAIYPGFESDTRFALTVISGEPRDISEFQVKVQAAKADYLRREKAGSLARAGIDSLTDAQLQSLIAEKIQRNYIYKLEFKHEKSFFNITLEIENPKHTTPTRMVASLEYQPNEQTLRLVTLY